VSRPLTLPPSRTGARLLSTGSYLPERVVTNDELAATMATDDQWIRDRVGIVSRRIARSDESLVDMAAAAGHAAITDAQLEPGDVDALILATCTPPSPIPNIAAQVATALRTGDIAAFDLNTACAGFSYSIAVAADLVRAGTATNVLVVGAEKFSDWIDPTDRSTAIIFADGAGAAVVGAADAEHGPTIGPVAWGSSGDQYDAIIIPDRSSFLHQEGQAVFRWATTKVAPVALRAVELAGLAPADVDILVPHQANLRILESLARALRKAGAREDMLLARDIVHTGNTSAASIPVALDHLRSSGAARSGQLALLVGFGAGLSFAAQAVRLP
jgi:3-oxoacyl-[acyl-carrier-protein] synthase-3